jgi:hypothetical protein
MGTSGSGDKVASDEPADELGDLGDDGVTEDDRADRGSDNRVPPRSATKISRRRR